MIELGKLEAQHEEFAKRNVRVIVASLEGKDDAKETQAEVPHLTVLSDPERRLAEAVAVVHPKSAQDGSDTTAPTTFLLDGAGVVRWAYRSGRVFTRLTPDQLLSAVDEHLRR